MPYFPENRKLQNLGDGLGQNKFHPKFNVAQYLDLLAIWCDIDLNSMPLLLKNTLSIKLASVALLLMEKCWVCSI